MGMMARVAGKMSAAPIPMSTRPTMSEPVCGATAQTTDEAPKTASPS